MRILEEAILKGTLTDARPLTRTSAGNPAQDGETQTGDDQAISPSSSVTRA